MRCISSDATQNPAGKWRPEENRLRFWLWLETTLPSVPLSVLPIRFFAVPSTFPFYCPSSLPFLFFVLPFIFSIDSNASLVEPLFWSHFDSFSSKGYAELFHEINMRFIQETSKLEQVFLATSKPQ